MNSVSFGSTFKINDLNSKKNIKNYGSVIDFCENNNLEYLEKTKVKETKKLNGFYSTDFKMTSTIISPDNKDSLVESFLANKGIDFKKFDSKDLLTKSKIVSRIENAPKDMKLAEVDVKGLKNLIKNQDNNIDYCKECYDNYYSDGVDSMIKSGDKIQATSLCITPMGESVDDTVDYIKKFGSKSLNDNQISVMFVQKTDEPDHCMLFGINDLGIDKVPVYVDKDTYKIGAALGILK